MIPRTGVLLVFLVLPTASPSTAQEARKPAEVVDILSRTRSEDDLELQNARENYANTLDFLGELGESRALRKEVLDVRTRVLGPDHPLVQAARLNYAICLRMPEDGEEIARCAETGAGGDAVRTAVAAKEAAEGRLLEAIRGLPGGGAVLAEIIARDIAAGIGAHDAAVGFWSLRGAGFGGGDRPESPQFVAFVVCADGGVEVVDLGEAGPIERAVSGWMAAVSSGNDGGAVDRYGERVRELVLDPVLASAGNVSRLIVAPDGILHHVAFDALPRGEGLVGDEIEIRIVPDLRALGTEPGALASPTLIAFGDVDYGAGATVATEAGTTVGVLEEPLRDRRPEFTPLPQSRAEILDLTAAFMKAHPKARAECFIGAKATKARLTAGAPGARFLHLATHGWFDPESTPSIQDARPVDARFGLGAFRSTRETLRGDAPFVLAGLALAGANNPSGPGGQIDGIITAEELAGIDLSGCELAALSACQSALGAYRPGQGLASLQRALHAAGVRHTLTSLWRVPDAATRELMAEFYRRIWELKQPKATALFEAKRMLREARDPETGKPRFQVRDWAGWVLCGMPER